MSAPLLSPIVVTCSTCHICSSKALTPVLSLGDQYSAASFASPNGKPPVGRRIPLATAIADMVQAEIEERPELERAKPLSNT